MVLLGILAMVLGVPVARRIHGVGVTSRAVGPLTSVGVVCGFVLAAAAPDGTGTAGLLVVTGGLMAGLIFTSPKLE